MPTDKGAKTAGETEAPRGTINRYGDGWGGVPYGIERGTKLTADEQKKAEKSYVRVQSETERLVKRGRWSLK